MKFNMIKHRQQLILLIYKMSEKVLQRSSVLCYFKLDPSIKNSEDQLMQPSTLPLIVYHFHYPAVYYSILFDHFKNSLPPQITKNHLCFKKNGYELPADLPLGLEIQNNDEVLLNIRELPFPDGFRLTMTSWKKGYTLVNRESGCDHVFKRLNQNQQRQLYNLHVQGHSTGLNKVPRYEGNCIALKIYCEKNLIQRRQENLDLSIAQHLQKTFGDLFLNKKQVLTHGVQVDLTMKLKTLLQDWNYNDGYCYLKITSS